MKGEFWKPIARFGFRAMGVILIAVGLFVGGAMVSAIVGGREVDLIVGVGPLLLLIVGAVPAYYGFTAKTGNLTVVNGRVSGEINAKAIDIPLSSLGSVSRRQRAVLILKTAEKKYTIGGLRNADALCEHIRKCLPLPEALRNAPDSVLAEEEARLTKAKRTRGFVFLAISLPMLAGVFLFVLGMGNEWNRTLCIACAAVGFALMIPFSILCNSHERKNAELEVIRRGRIKRAIEPTIREVPEGYEGVVRVIYQEGYTMRTIIHRGDEGYTYDVECYEDDRWMSDEDYEDEQFGEETDDGDDLGGEPSFFPTCEALMEYLEKEYHFAVFPIDEIVKFE